MKKQKLIILSLLTLLASGSVIAGSTYALFTDEAKTNIAINAATVDVEAEICDLMTSSMGVERNDLTFEGGGKAKLLENGDLSLSLVKPGDKVTFNVKIINKSNISIKYQTLIKSVSDEGLFSGLKIKVAHDGLNGTPETVSGFTSVSSWSDLYINEQPKNVVSVSIELPEDADNYYQNTSTTLSVAVNAVQGNAEVEEIDPNVISLYSAADLFSFAKDVNENNNSFVGKTVKLMEDIDLENRDWEPIGQTGNTQFLGTFDGQNHKIYNLKVDSSTEVGGNYSSGLFGWVERHGSDENDLMAVKNLTIKGATVSGHHNVAAIAGYLIGTIENCHVFDAHITCTHANDDACGDKAGVIAGIAAESNSLISNCTATDSTVAGGRDAGQIVGACIVGKVSNCVATNVSVTATNDCNGNNVRNDLIGRTN